MAVGVGRTEKSGPRALLTLYWCHDQCPQSSLPLKKTDVSEIDYQWLSRLHKGQMSSAGAPSTPPSKQRGLQEEPCHPSHTDFSGAPGPRSISWLWNIFNKFWSKGNILNKLYTKLTIPSLSTFLIEVLLYSIIQNVSFPVHRALLN